MSHDKGKSPPVFSAPRATGSSAPTKTSGVVGPIASLEGDEKKKSGRPTFDSRGNAVWEWKTETGKYSVDINTQRLKTLESSELSIEETARSKKPDLSLEEAKAGGGFNPYDRGSVNPVKAPAPARKPVKDLKRLQEWMEMKKRLANQKDDD